MEFTFDDILLLPQVSSVAPDEADIQFKGEDFELKIPIMSAAMDTVSGVTMVNKLAELGALGVLHSNMAIEVWQEEIQQLARDKWVGISLPPNAKGLEMFKFIQEQKFQQVVLVVDSAHGGAKSVVEFASMITDEHDQVIAGNVVTNDCAQKLYNAGVSLVKVGIGGGSICTTRIVSGVGRPQASAIEALREFPIVADGGIRTSGDIVKSFALGADLVMVGSLLAGTDEAPGEIVEIEGKMYKTYRGMGSLEAMDKGSDVRYRQGKMRNRVAEGVSGLVPYRGPVEKVLNNLVAGLRVGMGYLNAPNLIQLSNAEYVEISASAKAESRPHSIIERQI